MTAGDKSTAYTARGEIGRSNPQVHSGPSGTHACKFMHPHRKLHSNIHERKHTRPVECDNKFNIVRNNNVNLRSTALTGFVRAFNLHHTISYRIVRY